MKFYIFEDLCLMVLITTKISVKVKLCQKRLKNLPRYVHRKLYTKYIRIVHNDILSSTTHHTLNNITSLRIVVVIVSASISAPQIIFVIELGIHKKYIQYNWRHKLWQCLYSSFILNLPFNQLSCLLGQCVSSTDIFYRLLTCQK